MNINKSVSNNKIWMEKKITNINKALKSTGGAFVNGTNVMN